ncbi:MAG: S-layer family protein [Synechococcales bacterium]|nr:S-layer family protein [Synechococcales bacterium]
MLFVSLPTSIGAGDPRSLNWGRDRATLLAIVWLCLQASPPAIAQVRPDNTLPQPSTVITVDRLHEITGGTQRGGNLFHSFTEFSVPTDHTAFFNNAPNLDRIITRVTGGSISNLDGLIRANGTADLFLLNPNGVLIGPNAQLDIGGSFVVSTGDRLEFADGTSFSASDPQENSLLTVSVPIGLQYGADPGSIRIQGTGNQLVLDPDTFVIDRTHRPMGLQVQTGETLAFLGGDVILEGANLTAPGGRIELGSVDAHERISLTSSLDGWLPNYTEVENFQDIQLRQAASLDTSGAGAGAIHLQGERIHLRDGSTILANTIGDGIGSDLTLDATEQVMVSGFSTVETEAGEILPQFPSSIFVGLESGATGQGGGLIIQAPSLRVTNGGLISTNSLGIGQAGDLTVLVTESISLQGGIPELELPGGLLADVYSEGNGGDLTVTTRQLSVTGGAEISASTLGSGNAGNLWITADQVEVLFGAPFLGASAILTSVQPDATGNAGRLTIDTDWLTVAGGAVVSASTFGAGDGGTLRVMARLINLEGRSPAGNPSGLFVQTIDNSGSGGNLRIDTDTLRVADGALVSSSTFASGDAGDLQIRASQIQLEGTELYPTGLFAAVNEDATGNGGDLLIQTQILEVLNGAQIVAGTRGEGDAGFLQINAQEIVLSGRSGPYQSGLFASAIVGTGDGGDLSVRSDRLTIQNGATINASTFPSSGDRSSAGQGAAGSIEITTTDLQLIDQGSITASTAVAGEGNITIQANQIRLLEESAIATNSQGTEPGGNITVTTDLLLAAGNSDITANAVNAQGGRVVITAEGIYGTTFRPQTTELSDITASSELGAEFSGVVTLNTPDVDPSQGLVVLPENVIDPDTQIAAACEQNAGSEFVVTGRGGLPAHANQILRGYNLWHDLRLTALVPSDGIPSEEASPQPVAPLPSETDTNPNETIVEAQGWRRDRSGQVHLIGTHSPTLATAYRSNPCSP